jgi:formylglycine-generating enzyme required for sulfatase activity
MASWYDAATSCHALGKRLCWEAEWTAACEGPERVAFPYGWIRDAERCNLDHPSMMAFQRLLYSDDPATRRAEILRLDRSVPSGSMPLCVSDFGVRDMTGNYDEWVNAEEPTGVSQWAALKGGPWVRSRNACRPIFRGHSPGFRFHFISFRCCADARGATPRRPLGGLLPPRVPERLADEPWWPGRVVEAWE